MVIKSNKQDKQDKQDPNISLSSCSVVFMIEFAPPFRARPKVERIGGAMIRFIWLWFSFAMIRVGFNDIYTIFEQEGWDKCKAGEHRPTFFKE